MYCLNLINEGGERGDDLTTLLVVSKSKQKLMDYGNEQFDDEDSRIIWDDKGLGMCKNEYDPEQHYFEPWYLSITDYNVKEI